MEKVDCVRRFGSNCFLLTLILGLATLARVAALVVWQDDLQRDPNGYLDVAYGLVAGDGFVNSTTNQPTAARPPLYPVLLSIVVRLGGGPTSIGVLQLVLGVATVWLVYLLGKQLGTSQSETSQLGTSLPGASRVGLVAAGVVAVDPLLLKYTAAVMTETLFVFLTACLLLSIARCAESPTDRRRQAFVGAMFGLAALCRPTFWAFGMLWLAVELVRMTVSTERRERFHLLRLPWAGLLAAGLVVSPWVVRNVRVFDRPIVTTTHGGQTLLWGNNPVFYREVVTKSPATIWSAKSHADWQAGIDRRMLAETPPVVSETDRDRWLYAEAWSTIRQEPRMFLQSCSVRFARFWSPVPMGSVGSSLPHAVWYMVGLFYIVMFGGCLVGVWSLRGVGFERVQPLLILIAAFTCVHLVYWSNVRMRAPLMPALAVLFAFGLLWASARGQETLPSE